MTACVEKYERRPATFFDDRLRPRSRLVATLVRPDRADVATLRGGAGGKRRRFLVLIREDRLRWALSLYCAEPAASRGCVENVTNPQFLRRTGGFALAKRMYDVEALHAIASRAPDAHWAAQLKIAAALEDAGAEVGFATYERFLAGGPFYAARIAAFGLGEATTPEKPYAASCATYDVSRSLADPSKLQVAKVHPEDIRAFVSNYAAVYAKFDADPLPPFSAVAATVLGADRAARLTVLTGAPPLRR